MATLGVEESEQKEGVVVDGVIFIALVPVLFRHFLGAVEIGTL